MTAFRYADDDGRYPVQHGDVWQIGNATMACGDLEQDHGLRLLELIGETPDLTYTDPPWNAGNAASYRTKAGETRKVNFTDLLNRVIAAASRSPEAFLEMGRQHVNLLRRLLEHAGGVVLAEWDVTYLGTPRPSKLIRVAFNDQVTPFTGSAQGMDDLDTPAWAITNRTTPGQLVHDCCTGRGLTAVSAIKAGRRFVGLELAPRRAAITLQKLSRLTGLEPTPIGRLA